MSEDDGWVEDAGDDAQSRYRELMGQLSWRRRAGLYALGAGMLVPAAVYFAFSVAGGLLAAVLIRTGAQLTGSVGFWVTGLLVAGVLGLAGLAKEALCDDFREAAFGRRITSLLFGAGCALATFHLLNPEADPYPEGQVASAWRSDAKMAAADGSRFDWSKGRVAALLGQKGHTMCGSNDKAAHPDPKKVTPDLSVESVALEEARCGNDGHVGSLSMEVVAIICALDFALGWAWMALAGAKAWWCDGGAGAAAAAAVDLGTKAPRLVLDAAAWMRSSVWRGLRHGSAAWRRSAMEWSVVGFGKRAVRAGRTAIQGTGLFVSGLLGGVKELIVERALADPGKRAALEREALNRAALKGKTAVGRKRL